VSLITPSFFLADPQARPFVYDQRIDLTAPNAPTVSQGRYVVQEIVPPRGQVFLVKTFVPYAVRRTDVDTPSESFEYLASQPTDGFFSFEPLVNNNSPFLIDLDFNSPKVEAGPLNNNDRQRSKGISYCSTEPWNDVRNGWFNPLFSFLIPSNAVYRVVFSLLPISTLDGAQIPNAYQIGAGTKRVDFAGCITVGLQMSEQYYHGLVQRTTAKGMP